MSVAARGEKYGEQLGGAFISDGEAAVAGQPGQGTFDGPSVPPKRLAIVHTVSSDPRVDPVSASIFHDVNKMARLTWMDALPELDLEGAAPEASRGSIGSGQRPST
jgi:hypothetical protein